MAPVHKAVPCPEQIVSEPEIITTGGLLTVTITEAVSQQPEGSLQQTATEYDVLVVGQTVIEEVVCPPGNQT